MGRQRKRRTQRATLAEQLRAAIAAELAPEDGPSEYELAKEAGIAQGSLSRFLAGDRDWTLATADQLAQVLGLELTRSTFTRRARAMPEKAQAREPRPPAVAAIAAELPAAEA